MFETRRVYDEKRRAGGYRVLVDRMWPRGLKKEEVKPDLWLRDIAPSSELRKWFAHDPEKWDEFRKRYFRELKQRQGEVARLLEHERQGKVILLFGARDAEHNNAVALQQYLESHRGGKAA